MKKINENNWINSPACHMLVELLNASDNIKMRRKVCSVLDHYSKELSELKKVESLAFRQQLILMRRKHYLNELGGIGDKNLKMYAENVIIAISRQKIRETKKIKK